jgi:anti-sigma B factor antagonist
MPEHAAKHGLEIAVERHREVAIVRCRGRLVAGQTEHFYYEVKQLMPHHRQIVLDFEHVTHMDSSGLGSLARLYVSGKSANCVLDLMNAGKSIRHLLGITHMMSVFQTIGENNIRMG